MGNVKRQLSGRESNTFQQWERSNSAHIGEINDESDSDSEDGASDTSVKEDGAGSTAVVLKREKLVFNILRNFFSSKKIPEGSYFKVLTEDELKFSLKEPQSIEIKLNDGAGYLRSEPPKNKTTLLGIVKPSGSILYFHEPTLEEFLVNVTHADKKERKKRSFEYCQYLFALKQFGCKSGVTYFKYCAQEDGTFEIYEHNKETKFLSQKHADNVVLLKQLSGNSEKKLLVRKRSSIPLDKKYRETLRQLKVSNENAKNSRRLKVLRQEYEQDRKKHEKNIMTMDLIHKKKLDAIDTLAMIDADIYKEPYCANTIVTQTKANVPEEMQKYIDRLLPYKGKNLAELLSPDNENPLTDEQKIDIAEECLRLIALNYNPDHGFPKRLQRYVHGQLDLSHVCVLLESPHDKPEVNFVGFKGGEITEKAYFSDVFALGVVLKGLPTEGRQKNIKKTSVVPTVPTSTLEEGLLSHIDVEALDLARQHKYERLMKLANQMTLPKMNERPDAKTLWLTYKVILSYNCYAQITSRRNAQQATESLQLFQASSELEEYLEERKSKKRNRLAFLTRRVMNLLSRRTSTSEAYQHDKNNSPRRSLSWRAHNENLQQLMNRAFRSLSMNFSSETESPSSKPTLSRSSSSSMMFSRMLSFSSRASSESKISSNRQNSPSSPFSGSTKKKPLSSRSSKLNNKKKGSYVRSKKMKKTPVPWEDVFHEDKRLMALSDHSRYK